MSTHHLDPIRFNEKISCSPADDLFLRRNFNLCDAIDLNKLRVVLDELVQNAGMHPGIAAIFFAQADALRQHLRAENCRLHGF